MPHRIERILIEQLTIINTNSTGALISFRNSTYRDEKKNRKGSPKGNDVDRDGACLISRSRRGGTASGRRRGTVEHARSRGWPL